MRTSPVDITKLENRLGETELKLYYTRELVLRLLPKELRTLLKDYSLGEDWYSWDMRVIERVVSLATVSDDGMGYSSDRGHCPLCKHGVDYPQGFTLPTGLTRHLSGSHGAKICEVMEAATRVAKDHFLLLRNVELVRNT